MTGAARRTDLRLDGARTVSVRPGPGGAWVVADDAGRIIALDEVGRVVLDVRV